MACNNHHALNTPTTNLIGGGVGGATGGHYVSIGGEKAGELLYEY